MDELHLLIDQGVAYEDQFVTKYFDLIHDDGFMELFGTHKEEARKLFITMIDDSKGHREGLMKLKDSLN